MSGPLDAMDFRIDPAATGAGRAWGDPKPPPSFGEIFTAARTAQEVNNSDWQDIVYDDEFDPLIAALNERRARRGELAITGPSRGFKPENALKLADIRASGGGSGYAYASGSGGISREAVAQAILSEVERERQLDPKAFAGIETRLDRFMAPRLAREADKRRQAGTVLARGQGASSLLATFAGGATKAMEDPVNIATLPIGGAGKTLATRLLGDVAVNLGIEVFQLPGMIENRALLGETMTAGDVAEDLAFAAGGAAVFRLGTEGAVAAVRGGYNVAGRPFDAVIERLGKEATDYQLARALEQAVPMEIRTPELQAALNVSGRALEVDASSPYVASHEGLASHGSRLAEVMAEIEALPRPSSSAAPPIAAAPPKPRSAGQGQAGYSNQIYQGLLARGLPEHTARGVAAGIHAESASNPHVRGGYQGRALGLGQWLGERRAEILRRYGPNPSLDQQLDFLVWELRGGDHGGASVLKAADEVAVLDAYIGETRADGTGWGFMRPLHGDQRKGDIERGMAALGRGGEDMPAGLTGPAAPAPIVRPDALDAVRPAVTAGNRSLAIETFTPDQIGVDAALMQFKSGGDALGVTDRLRGVAEWDPMAAGIITVWQGKDGKVMVADGHQRLGLAKRIQGGDPAARIELPAFVLRESDGFTARDARVLTALKNIGEGTGSAVDAAKVLRDAGLDYGDAVARRLPPRSALVRDGKSLSRLSDEAFGAVVNEVIPESWGAAIGELAPDPATHAGLVELLARIEPPNRRQAESVVRQAIDAGFVNEQQVELFGTRDLTTALFAHKAKALDRTLAELRKMKGAFGVAARNAEALDAAGNRIDVDASQAAAATNARAIALIDALALRKGNAVNDLFNRAAERLGNGEKIDRVVKDLVRDLGQLDLAQLARGADDAGATGSAAAAFDSPGGSRRDGLAESEADALSGEPADLTPNDLSPATLDELEAAGQAGFALFDAPTHQAFDDPRGDGVRAVADSAWHDIRVLRQAQDERVADGDIGARLQAWIAEDPARARAAYEALPDSDGGRIINTDTARELSAEYRADRSRSSEVHEPASALVKQIYAAKLAEPVAPGLERRVLFTSGGTGAGKSAGLAALGRAAENAGIIYDTNMNTLASSIDKIDQALAAGWEVDIAYTFRDPIEALVKGALPRAERMGRTVPLDVHIETHVGARQTIDALAQHYGADPRVAINVIDNRHGKNNARLEALENIPPINEVGLYDQAYAETLGAFERGDLGEPTLRGTLGQRAGELRRSPPARGEGPGAGDRGQPQPQRDGARPLGPALRQAQGEPEPLFDLDDGKGARPIAAIEAELKAWDDGLDAISACL